MCDSYQRWLFTMPVHGWFYAIFLTAAASEAEVIEMMKVLLEKGLGVNDKTSSGDTVLHLAVSNNKGGANDSTVLEEFLISQKADLFAKNSRGTMPIHCVFEKYVTM